MKMALPSFVTSLFKNGRDVDAGPKPNAQARAGFETEADTVPAALPDASIDTGTGDIIGGASRAILICFGLFVLWGISFPLSSAVIAQGSLVSSGFNQLVQHPTGGTVIEILARDGDLVAAGDTIARLDPANATAELSTLKARRATLLAIEERLRSARQDDGTANGSLRDTLDAVETADDGPLTLDEKLRLEQLRARFEGRVSLDASLEALRRQTSSAEAQLGGIDRNIANLESKIAIYAEQSESVRRLVDAGHIARRDLWASEDQLLDARTQLNGLIAEKGMAEERLGELEANSAELLGTTARDDAVQLTEIIGELGQIEDQILAAERALAQSDLRAPVAGTLVSSTLVTRGGVAPPGETLAEIVPIDDRMIFQARLFPQDIDHVRIGQDAEIEVTAFNMRLMQRLEGTVVYVSADTTQDPQTGESYYLARIAMAESAASDPLRAGMVGTAYIAGPSRNFFAYIFQPLIEGYRHAFRESR